MKKNFIYLAIFAIALIITGCPSPLESVKDNPSGGGRRNVIPKLNAAQMISARSARIISNPGADFEITHEFDVEHSIVVPKSRENEFFARIRAPIFEGFEYGEVSEATVIISDFFGRKITTEVSVTEAGTEYYGRFNDNGGWYKMVITESGNYTFEQYVILDILQVNDVDYTWTDSPYSYVSEWPKRFVYYANASGVISVNDEGKLISDGQMYSNTFEFTPTAWGGLHVDGPFDFRFRDDVNYEYWGYGWAYHYTFNTKSRPGFFGIINASDVSLGVVDFDAFRIHIPQDTYNNFGVWRYGNIFYTNEALFQLSKDFGEEVNSGITTQYPAGEQLYYMENGQWGKFISADGGMQGMIYDPNVHIKWNQYP